MLECDYLTVGSVFFKRFYILFVIELQSRRVHLAGITANPDGAWVTQQARNLLMRLDDEGVRAPFLIRDRDSKFTRDFDEVFRSQGIRVINGHRPHRSLGQRPPLAKPPPIGEPALTNEPIPLDRLRRRDQLGGLLHEYELAA